VTKDATPDKRPPIDWEAIEREYRLGRLSVREIATRYGVSHTAIAKRAAKSEWTRDLADKVRAAAKQLLLPSVSKARAETSESATVETAATEAADIVRGHRKQIGRGQRIVAMIFGELEEATEFREDIAKAIDEECEGDATQRRANMLRRAVAMQARSVVVGNLAAALRVLTALERQAYDMAEDPPKADTPAVVVEIIKFGDMADE
jgi:hypothetical protein